jgi:hypothetical protein
MAKPVRRYRNTKGRFTRRPRNARGRFTKKVRRTSTRRANRK